ncbi:MAG: cation-transporting P-type ATPase [Nitrososphaerota archaeon]
MSLGLRQDEVESRLEQYGYNEVLEEKFTLFSCSPESFGFNCLDD